MRSLPIISSLLAFPSIYWLCIELFASSGVAWLAMALFAVSPICVRYAQEVRQYSLWLAIVALATAALLKAIRQPTKINWGVYTLSLIVGIYCHLLTFLTIIAHGIYILIIERFRLTKTVIGYLSSSLVSLAFALPWIWVIWQNREIVWQTTDWMRLPLPLNSATQLWSMSISRFFMAWHFKYNYLLFYLTAPAIILIVYAVYFLCRRTPPKIWLLVMSLITTTVLPFLLLDLIGGGRRSTYDRYFLPAYLGGYLAIAYFLSYQIDGELISHKRRQVWQWIAAGILTVGIFSCAVGSLAPTWWGWSEFDVEIGKIIDKSPNSLIITDMPFGVVAPLSHQIKPDSKLLLLSNTKDLKIPDGFSRVFVHNPTDNLLSALEQQGKKLKLTYRFTDPTTTLVISLYELVSS
jgi:uncharacterized membrane protein